MSQSLMFTQALLALLGLFGGAWFLLNPKNLKDPLHSALAGCTNVAVAAYLLCVIGVTHALETSQLVFFEKAATGFAIAIFGLVPWSLSRAQSEKSSPYLVPHTCVAIILAVANLFRPVSLRFENLALLSTQPSNIQSKGSLLMIPYLGLTLSMALYFIYIVAWAKRNGAKKTVFLLILTASATGVLSIIESLNVAAAQHSAQYLWVAMPLLALSSTVIRFNAKSPPRAQPSPQRAKAEAPPPQLEPTDPSSEQHALVLWLEEQDAEFATKILSSKGFVVTRENKAGKIPVPHFTPPDVRLSILFNRDLTTHLPAEISRISQRADSRISLIAVTHKPRSPRIIREMRSGHYQNAIASPLKATELFKFLESQNDYKYTGTQIHHPYLS